MGRSSIPAALTMTLSRFLAEVVLSRARIKVPQAIVSQKLADSRCLKRQEGLTRSTRHPEP